MVMSPLQYADKYRNLEVYLYTDAQAKAATGGGLPPGGSWHTVNVDSYRLGLKKAWQSTQNSIEVFKSKVRPHLNEKHESITVWVKTIGGDLVSKTYTDRYALAENVNDPFYGKGSPEEVQVVLQLAVRYGVFPIEKVQIYCDNGNIGLDCNGFVGNYLRHVVQGLPWDSDARSKEEKKTEFDANTLIKNIMGFSGRTTPVKSLEEIAQHPHAVYLLGMAHENGILHDQGRNADGSVSHGHIMISEPGALWDRKDVVVPGVGKVPAAIEMQVIESTGGDGLVDSTYFLYGGNKFHAFTAHRGVKNARMTVRVARLN
jgi:hypothetical protein